MFLTKILLKEFKDIIERITKVESKLDTIEKLEDQIKTQQLVINEMVDGYNYMLDVMIEIDSVKVKEHEMEHKTYVDILKEKGLDWQN